MSPRDAEAATRVIRQSPPRLRPQDREAVIELEPIGWNGRGSLQDYLARRRGEPPCALETFRGSTLGKGPAYQISRGLR